MLNFNYLFKQLNLLKLQKILLNDEYFLVGTITSPSFFSNFDKFSFFKTFIFKNSYLSYLTSKTDFFPKGQIAGKCVIISFPSKVEMESFDLKSHSKYFQPLFFSQNGVIFNFEGYKIKTLDKEQLLTDINVKVMNGPLGVQKLLTSVYSKFYLQLLTKNKN